MRDSLVPVAVALFCIVAVGLSAASLTTDLGGGDANSQLTDSIADSNQSSDSGGVNGAGGGAGQQTQSIQEDDECVAGYNQTEITWIATVLVIGIATLVVIHTRELLLGVITVPMLMVPALFVMVAIFSFLGCPLPDVEAANAVPEPNITEQPNGWEFTNEGEESSSLVDRLKFGSIFVGFILCAFLLGFYVKRRNADSPVDDQTNRIQTSGVDSEIAAAAGEAADELAGGSDSHNAVYRAWAKMTEVLDVEHPETSTPREFADAALDAGLDPDDVSELTGLFETVRYGTTPVTAEHEKRAREALRRIEQDYAGEVEGAFTGESTDEPTPSSTRDDERSEGDRWS